MKSKIVTVVIVLLFVLSVTASSCQGVQAIKKATLRDNIFSVEQRVNGAFVMWMVHDDVGTYCTADMDIAKVATEALTKGKQVLVTYRTLNVDDSENGAFGGLFQGQCNTDRGSGNNTNYVVTDISIPEE